MLGGKSTRQRQLITKAVLPESSLLAAQEPSTDPQSSWGWKAALEVARSNTLLRAGSATTGCSGLCQSGFEDLQGWKLHHLSGQPAPACDHQQSESVFLCLDGISCISVCCHCHWSCHWAPLRRVWLHCLYSLHQEFISELSPSWSAPDLSASPCMTDRCFNPSITLVAFCRPYSSVSTSLTPGIPVLDSALLICLPLPLVTLCLLQPIALLAFFVEIPHPTWCLMPTSPQCPAGPFLQSCVPGGWPPACAVACHYFFQDAGLGIPLLDLKMIQQPVNFCQGKPIPAAFPCHFWALKGDSPCSCPYLQVLLMCITSRNRSNGNKNQQPKNGFLS